MEAPFSPILFLPLPIVLVVSLYAPLGRPLALVVLAALASWYCSVQVLRYLLPIVPIVSLLTAAVADRAVRSMRATRRSLVNGAVTILGGVLLISTGWLYAASVVRERDLPPVTSAGRDAYLSAALPSYPAYKMLNERHSRDYRLYALCDAHMAYFADGVFMGDWFGPARYAPIMGAMGNGAALYRTLRMLGADYLLLADRPPCPRELPQDDFTRSRFTPVYTGAGGSLFRVAPDRR